MSMNGIMSNWLEHTVLEYILSEGDSPTVGVRSGSGPWLALYTTDPWESGSGTEVTGTGYERVYLPVNTFIEKISFSSACVVYYNPEKIYFPPAGASDWGTITHVGITTASFVTGTRPEVTQQLMFSASLPVAVTPLVGDTFRIRDESFEITLYNAFQPYISRVILKAALNTENTDLSPNRYLALYDIPDPGTSYTEITGGGYSRKSIYSTMPPSFWEAYTGGSTANMSALYFDYATTDWGDVKGVGIVNILTGTVTNILMLCPLGSGSRTIYDGDRIYFPARSIKIGADDDEIRT